MLVDFVAQTFQNIHVLQATLHSEHLMRQYFGIGDLTFWGSNNEIHVFSHPMTCSEADLQPPFLIL